MNEIVYFAEIEFFQANEVNLDQLEKLEDSIFEAQENVPEEEQIIDEDKVVVDEEEGFLLVVTRDFEDLDTLKSELKKMISSLVDPAQFEFAAHIYKDEYVAMIENVNQL